MEPVARCGIAYIKPTTLRHLWLLGKWQKYQLHIMEDSVNNGAKIRSSEFARLLYKRVHEFNNGKRDNILLLVWFVPHFIIQIWIDEINSISEIRHFSLSLLELLWIETFYSILVHLFDFRIVCFFHILYYLFCFWT